MLPLFGLTIFVAAGLVFLVQPMMAKLLLPYFGGTPQVWIAAMVFFQAALLLGYAYAHASFRLLGLRRQPLAHLLLILLPLIALPIAVRSAELASGTVPALAVLGILALSVGAPYVAVTAASPILQRWFSTTGHPSAADPYFLYAASNAGSFAGLLAFPIILEPVLRSADQTALWSAGYLAYAALSGACAAVVIRAARPAGGDVGLPLPEVATTARPAAVAIGPARQARWVMLAFVPSSLMLGVTTHLSADIAAAPLLWVIPLALYLATFIVAFSRRLAGAPRLASRVLPILAGLVGLSLLRVLPLPIWATMGVHYVAFFVAGTAVHGRLAADRPPATELTRFFLLVSLGGVLGGIFNALVAPIVFDSVLEYPLALVLAVMVGRRRAPMSAAADQRRERRARLLDLLVPLALYLAVLIALAAASILAGAGAGPMLGAILVAAVIASLLAVRRPVRFALALGAVLAVGLLVGRGALFSDRTFFGINRVVDDGAGRHVYLSGTTIHGVQRTNPGRSLEPLSYYHRSGPVGDVFAELAGRPVHRDIAVVGLGAGGMAAYARDGDSWTFYEIDPVVDRIARDAGLFTYLRDAPGDIRTVIGDGRLELAEASDARFDAIFLDAFTGDAVPAHLLTREAGALYLDKLRPGGLLVFNVSNRYLDVRAVVTGLARSLGLVAVTRLDGDVTAAPPGDKEISEFVVVARSESDLAGLAGRPGWVIISDADRAVTWTDDFSNILAVIDWAR